jgi:hypothetical protein
MGDDRCRMRALDNALGQIEDYGVVNCSKASNQNFDAWRRAMDQDRFVEIVKSFRHESNREASEGYAVRLHRSQRWRVASQSLGTGTVHRIKCKVVAT